MSERDQFEAWWEEWFGEAPMSGWNNLRTDSGYSAEEIDIQWEAWMGRASREALKAEQESAWIACSEQMPNDGDAVTVCDHGIDVYPAVFSNGEFYEYSDRIIIEESTRMSNPTHWQPLPAPPSQSHPIDTTS